MQERDAASQMIENKERLRRNVMQDRHAGLKARAPGKPLEEAHDVLRGIADETSGERDSMPRSCRPGHTALDDGLGLWRAGEPVTQRGQQLAW